MVYVEITYIMNALIIVCTFEILCFLLSVKMNVKQLIIYAITFNLSILFLYFDLLPGMLMIYDFLLCLIYYRRLVYIYYPLYMFVYISITSFMSYILPSSFLFQGILVIEGFQFISLFPVMMILLVIAYLYIYYCQEKISCHDYVTVRFLTHECYGFVDNGNKVFYKGYPVIFIHYSFLKGYQRLDTIVIETASQKEEVDIIVLKEVWIKDKKLNHVYVGVMTSQCYDCIINGKILGGLL